MKFIKSTPAEPVRVVGLPEGHDSFLPLQPIKSLAELVEFWETMVVRLKSAHYAKHPENAFLAAGMEGCIKDIREMAAVDRIPLEIHLTPTQRRALVDAAAADGGLDVDVKKKLGLTDAPAVSVSVSATPT